MALILNDRVKETSTTTGQGTLSLAGAATGFETFVTGIGDNNTTYYAIVHESNGTWELGIGTVDDASPDTLARTTVIDTSSGNTTKIDFAAGSKTVFCTLPASKSVFLDADGDVTLGANLDVAGNLVVTGTTTFNGGTLTLGDANTDNIVFGGEVDSDIIPDDDGTFDLGSASKEWQDIFIDGTAKIDTLTVDENATIAGTLGVTGVLTGTSLDISGDIDIDGTTNLDIVDIDGAVDMATTLTLGGNADFNGDLDVDGTTNLDVVDIDGAVDMATTLTLGGNADFNGDLDVDGTTNLDVVDIDGAVDFASTTAHAGNASFADNAKAIFGAGDDFEIYHSGTASIIREASAGNLTLAGNDVQITNGAMNETHIDCNNNGSVDLYHNNVKKLETTATGVDVTGVITTDGLTTSADINFGDSDKALFGAGDDLQIYHDGSNSYVDDAGTGRLFLRGNDRVQIQKYTGEDMISCLADGAVNIYHDNAKKFETTATGISVTGAFTATAASTITTADNTDTLSLVSTDADAEQGPVLRLTRDSSSPANNDVLGRIFFTGEDAGSNATNYVQITSQASNVAEGSETANFQFEMFSGGSNVEFLKFQGGTGTVFNEGSADLDFRVESNGNANMLFVDGGNDHVNIGTSSDLGGVLNVSGTAVFSSTSADDNFVITSTDADAGDPAPDLVLYRNSSSPANGDDIGRIEFRARNNNSQDIVPVTFSAFTAVVTDGAETGNFAISTLIGGSQINRMGFDTTETTFNDGSADLDFRVESNGNTHALFVDGGNDHVNIGTATDLGGVLNVSGTAVIQTADNTDTLTLTSTDTDVNVGPNLRLYRNSSNPQDNNYNGAIQFEWRNDNSQDVIGAEIQSFTRDASDGTEDNILWFQNMTGGTLTEYLRMDNQSGQAMFVVNEGSADIDFRVESNGNTHMLFVDGGNNRVGIGTTPDLGVGLHIRTADSGASNVANADDLIIEGSGVAGMSIFTGTSSAGQINFGDSGANERGKLLYDHNGDYMALYANSSERMRILSTGNICIGQTDDQGGTRLLVAYDEADDSAGHYRATNASYVNIVLKSSTNKAANTNFSLLKCLTNNEADAEFDVRGDGNVFSDGGTAMGSPADYAEMFEWKDSNTGSEERFGYSVILDGNKIVKATDSDDASKIIGVVSANPAVLGDAACMRWSNKYLRDEWNKSIEEEYTVTEWTEAVEDGDDIEHSYPTDAIPDGVTAPSDATILTTEKDKYGNDVSIKRRKLNADFDGSKTYIPRIERKEWDAIGMMGKLRLKKGQPTGTNWIKMRDISSDVEEWLVR